MAKIIHTSDKIKLSKIDMALLHAVAEHEGLTEIPDYTIFAINPRLWDQIEQNTRQWAEVEAKRILAERQRAS